MVRLLSLKGFRAARMFLLSNAVAFYEFLTQFSMLSRP